MNPSPSVPSSNRAPSLQQMTRSHSFGSSLDSPGPVTPVQLPVSLSHRTQSKPTPLSDIASRPVSPGSVLPTPSSPPMASEIRKDSSFSFDDPYGGTDRPPTSVAAAQIASLDSTRILSYRRASDEDNKTPTAMVEARKAIFGADLDEERRAEMAEVERVRQQRELAKRSLVGSKEGAPREGEGALDESDQPSLCSADVVADRLDAADSESDSDRSLFGSHSPHQRRPRPTRSKSQPCESARARGRSSIGP